LSNVGLQDLTLSIPAHLFQATLESDVRSIESCMTRAGYGFDYWSDCYLILTPE